MCRLSTFATVFDAMKTWLIVFAIAASLAGCLPKDSVQLRAVNNISLEPGVPPVLTGDAVFFNPNTSRMRLKQVKIDVLVDGKKSASVDHDLNIIAKPNSEFTIPLKVQLQMEDLGIVQTLKNLFGGKKYELHYVGHLKVNVNGFPMRIPIDHKEEFKIGF